MQSVLLYGSETWVLSLAVMARLEGFHIRAAYWMAKRHVPRRGTNHQWVSVLGGGAGGVWYAHNPALHRRAKGDNCTVCGWAQHLCRMPGSRPTVRFGAPAVVVGTEDDLGRRVIYLSLATEPFCSSLEPSGHGGRMAGARQMQLDRVF